MKFQKSGFVMIDALIAFMIVSVTVTLLAKSSIAIGKHGILLENRDMQRIEMEMLWWNESNGGCRDICLIDVLAYPWR